MKERAYQKYRDSDSIRPRGRPKMNQSLVARHHILIDDSIKMILDTNHKPNERYNDTMHRLLRQSRESIKKVEALQSETERLRLQYSNLRASIIKHEEPNELLQVKIGK
jgi:hypothetical protein